MWKTEKDMIEDTLSHRIKLKMKLDGIRKLSSNGIKRTVQWYLENEDWMGNVTSGDYQKYYEEMYD